MPCGAYPDDVSELAWSSRLESFTRPTKACPSSSISSDHSSGCCGHLGSTVNFRAGSTTSAFRMKLRPTIILFLRRLRLTRFTCTEREIFPRQSVSITTGRLRCFPSGLFILVNRTNLRSSWTLWPWSFTILKRTQLSPPRLNRCIERACNEEWSAPVSSFALKMSPPGSTRTCSITPTTVIPSEAMLCATAKNGITNSRPKNKGFTTPPITKDR